MILQKLCDYYDRLGSDPEVDIAPLGNVVEKVAFAIVLDAEGKLIGIHDLRDSDGKKARPRNMILPGKKKPSGSGLNPSLHGWDRTDYMLGYFNPEGLKPDELEKKLKKCKQYHQAFKEKMLARRTAITHPDYQAFCNFLEAWMPERAVDYPLLQEISGNYGVVRFNGEPMRYLHEIPELQELNEEEAKGGKIGFCLVSGIEGSIAATHGIKIKGVPGAQSTGAALVSFNQPAFESYGKSQSYNAPVSETAAFKYATALNQLLERDSGHRVMCGDTACVFWADQPSRGEDLFQFGLECETAEDSASAQKLEADFRAIRDGLAPVPDESVGFYVLGLAPNAGRVAVRFWYSGTLGEMLKKVIRHQQQLTIVRSEKDRDYLPIWLLLAQTARESKEIPPLLGGALMRAILTGGPYPQALFNAVIRRLRAEHNIRHPRAAIIKAILCRNYQKEGLEMLDSNRPEPAYQMGRLFAALERAQEDALPGINATIKDRFFGAASATPGSVFPRLIRGSQHHLGKLEGGRKVVAEKRIQEICGKLDNFPAHLDLPGQGLFALGYYHQRQDFFQKKDPKVTPDEESQAGEATN